jgi:2-phospho-L-lactate guanylyltransferase (CobY/MobA/RfbA family)
VIEVTDWAVDILTRAQAAARRFDAGARIRLARVDGGVQAVLAQGPQPGDWEVVVGDMVLLVEEGLEGLLDVEEPHDRLVLRSAGSSPNPRGEHG